MFNENKYFIGIGILGNYIFGYVSQKYILPNLWIYNGSHRYIHKVYLNHKYLIKCFSNSMKKSDGAMPDLISYYIFLIRTTLELSNNVNSLRQRSYLLNRVIVNISSDTLVKHYRLDSAAPRKSSEYLQVNHI